MSNKMTRRSFLQKSGIAAIGMTIIPGVAMGRSFSGATAPSDKLNIAGIGIGGRGASVLRSMSSQNIVALCDVDWKYSKRVFDEYPNAKKYWDFRKMYDEMHRSIDAVVVATADHTHATIAANAMTLGKHVYLEKPLTHSVYESRLLTKLAEKHKLATQMGNQGSSGEGVSLMCEWIWNGEIGQVKKVECATNRPIWPQGLNAPTQGQWVPDTLNWELFTGPAEMRPYNEIYHPWNWRGWWPYGTGALGDMACHIMHPVFKALKLGYPTKVEGSSTLLLTDCAPTAQHVKLTFPAREKMKKVALPEVEVHWYDGGLLPDRPKGFPQGRALMPNNGGLVIFHGTKDTLICECYGEKPWLLSGREPNVPKTLRRVEGSHEMDWVRACKENSANRTLTASDFSEAGPFNEMVVMGVLAVRLQGLNKTLEWDGLNMQFTNIADDEEFEMILKDDFKIVDGHPSFDKPSIKINAKSFSQELIKHTYRDGWSLPAMP